MKSINKALDILEVLLNNPDSELRLSELCQLTGLNKSTANRIVSILIKRGYVSQKEKRGKYSLSTRFLTSSGQIRQSKRIRDIAKPYLSKLGYAFNESVILAIRDLNHAYIVDAFVSTNILTTTVAVGSKLPMFCTSAGKIFLANMTEPELEKYIVNVGFQQYTVNTITDPRRLRAALKIVKEEGAAYDNEEQWVGLTSLGVGIYNKEGKSIAALGIVGPSVRLTEDKMPAMIKELKACAAGISESAG
jgi:DNA-binding IclR family transcriptional regulator